MNDDPNTTGAEAAGQNRRLFLIALAVAAIAVGVPLAGLTMWWGSTVAYALSKAAGPREAF